MPPTNLETLQIKNMAVKTLTVEIPTKVNFC